MGDYRRILAIDGGGVKGAIPAAFLALMEQTTGRRIADDFDLIVGTSTGGIIALGLGLGVSAPEILALYEENAKSIFPQSGGVWRSFRRLWSPKHDETKLRAALISVLQDKTLGDACTRVVVPAFNSDLGKVHVFKTSHHPRFTQDWSVRCVDVAMATAAAPTFFASYHLPTFVSLVDGGVWANNPVGLAVVEGIGVLNWRPEEIRVLSLGCSEAPFSGPERGGLWQWVRGNALIDLLGQAQSYGSLGTASILLHHSEADPRVFRFQPVVSRGRFSLDNAAKVPELIAAGRALARDAMPTLEAIFSGGEREPFEPCHRAPSG